MNTPRSPRPPCPPHGRSAGRPRSASAGVLVAATVLARSAGSGPRTSSWRSPRPASPRSSCRGLHDPAAALLAAVPVSVMQRRVLRLALVLAAAGARGVVLLDSLTAAHGVGARSTAGPRRRAGWPSHCGHPCDGPLVVGGVPPGGLFALPSAFLPSGTVADVVRLVADGAVVGARGRDAPLRRGATAMSTVTTVRPATAASAPAHGTRALGRHRGTPDAAQPAASGSRAWR